jgi:hypothetical protein
MLPVAFTPFYRAKGINRNPYMYYGSLILQLLTYHGNAGVLRPVAFAGFHSSTTRRPPPSRSFANPPIMLSPRMIVLGE